MEIYSRPGFVVGYYELLLDYKNKIVLHFLEPWDLEKCNWTRSVIVIAGRKLETIYSNDFDGL